MPASLTQRSLAAVLVAFAIACSVAITIVVTAPHASAAPTAPARASLRHATGESCHSTHHHPPSNAGHGLNS